MLKRALPGGGDPGMRSKPGQRNGSPQSDPNQGTRNQNLHKPLTTGLKWVRPRLRVRLTPPIFFQEGFSFLGGCLPLPAFGGVLGLLLILSVHSMVQSAPRFVPLIMGRLDGLAVTATERTIDSRLEQQITMPFRLEATWGFAS